MHSIHVAAFPGILALSAASFSTEQSARAAAKERTNFSGTWRSNNIDWMDTPVGLRPERDPKLQLIVSQETDSIRVVLETLEESNDKVKLSQTPLTYRFEGEWSGPFNVPPNSTVSTGASWIEAGEMLELSSTVFFARSDGKGEYRITSLEIWSLQSGVLWRRIRQRLPSTGFIQFGTINRMESFRRVSA